MIASELLALQIEGAAEGERATAPKLRPITDADADVERGIDLGASLARLDRHRRALKSGTLSRMALLEKNYLDALRALDLDHHSPVELLLPMKRVHRSGVKNRLPHPSLGPRLFFVALYLDLQRKMFGSATRQTSIYRHPDYNRAIGGARFSQHQSMSAADSQAVNGDRRGLQATADALGGVRIKLTPMQRAVFKTWIRRYRLGSGVFSGSVRGERIDPRGLRAKTAAPGAGITIVGGQGDYRWGSHRDLRGTRVRW